MKFSAEMVNTALTLSLDWGDCFMLSIHERMKQRHPELNKQELDFLNSMCYHTVQPFCWQRFCEIHEMGISLFQALVAIQNEFPWINEENFILLKEQGSYYAHRKKPAIRRSLTQTDHSWKSTSAP